METQTGSTSAGVNFVNTFQEALRVPHLHVALPHNTPLNSIEETLADACCGLLLGDRPNVFVDKKHHVAVIPIPSDRIERVLYKSYIIHKPSGARYQCTFNSGEVKVLAQKRISIELPGAKFAWLKAQALIRDRLYSYEPLIRVNWQQCTGADTCKIHLHYSSEDESTLQEAQALRDWIIAEAEKVIVRSFPLYVPPRNRYPLSSDPKFREIAYNHHVSLWTRTMKDSPIGNEWCTFATDDAEQMEATLVAYKEYGMNTKWGAKSSASSPSQSPPESSSPIARGSRGFSSPAAPTAAILSSNHSNSNNNNSVERSTLTQRSISDSPVAALASSMRTMPLEAPSLPPGLTVPHSAPTSPVSSASFMDRSYSYVPSLYADPTHAWDKFLMPTDAFSVGSPATPYAASGASDCFNLLFQQSTPTDLFSDPQDFHRYNSLTDSYSG